jgi:hypothetical protein
MKKVLYFILLAAEVFVGTVLMIALWDSHLYIPIAIAAVALVALLTWQIVLFIKASDMALKKKIMLRIALIMLIPIAVFIATYIFVVIVFVIAYSF